MDPAVDADDLVGDVSVVQDGDGQVGDLFGLAEPSYGMRAASSLGSPRTMPVSSMSAGAIALTVTPSAATRYAK
jgi:hypothetical protein